MIYTVLNLFRTTSNPCKCCDTWLDHWKNNAGQKDPVCAYKDCQKQATAGSHVTRDNSDFFWYIIPLCDEHLKARDVFEIKSKMIKIKKLEGCKRTS